MYRQTGEEIEIDLGRLFKVLWRGKGYILWIAALFALTALLISIVFVPKKYQASVMFYVDGIGVNPAMVVLETAETLNSVRVLSGTNWSNEELKDMLDAQSVEDTGFFRVTVTCSGASNSHKLANAVMAALPMRVPSVIPSATLYVAEGPVMDDKPAIPDYPTVALVAGALGIGLGITVIGAQAVFVPKRKRRPNPAREASEPSPIREGPKI